MKPISTNQNEEFTALTEHHLQTHHAGHKVIEVDGHVCVSIACSQTLMNAVIQRESCEMVTNKSSYFDKLRFTCCLQITKTAPHIMAFRNILTVMYHNSLKTHFKNKHLNEGQRSAYLLLSKPCASLVYSYSRTHPCHSSYK